MRFIAAALPLLLAASLSTAARADDGSLQAQAAAALRKAAEFFTTRVATEGGYLWRYSDDLAKREGEGKARDTVVWVQPPGTPSVGEALLDAHRATGDRYYLDAARRAGECLVRGQLRSGGWDYHIEFDPERRAGYAYRADPPAQDRKQRNTSTLDDDTTQAALRFLMRLDEATGLKDARIHEAAQAGLAALLAVQYPNGAWPQRFEGPPDAAAFPVRRAAYPESWSREFPGKDYKGFYTFNDNAMGDAIALLFEAARVYGEERYARAARRGGDFILLAQMPDPQPGWAQQYDADMHPAWARKFEPPSVTGGESQGVMRTLLALYAQTGEAKYLEPIPRAIAYYRKSALPDGRLARFYELKTNRPLYFTKTYALTYDDGDVPTHYAFKVGQDLDAIEREYDRLKGLKPEDLARMRDRKPSPPGKPSPRQIEDARRVLAALDDQGRWVEEGRLKYHGQDDPTRRVIDCQTFVKNVRVLCRLLAATSPRPPASPPGSAR